MDVAQFLATVAEKGFTEACDIFDIGRTRLKDMCDYIIKNSDIQLTPYQTRQQIVYFYCSVKIRNMSAQN